MGAVGRSLLSQVGAETLAELAAFLEEAEAAGADPRGLLRDMLTVTRGILKEEPHTLTVTRGLFTQAWEAGFYPELLRLVEALLDYRKKILGPKRPVRNFRIIS